MRAGYRENVTLMGSAWREVTAGEMRRKNADRKQKVEKCEERDGGVTFECFYVIQADKCCQCCEMYPCRTT